MHYKNMQVGVEKNSQCTGFRHLGKHTVCSSKKRTNKPQRLSCSCGPIFSGRQVNLQILLQQSTVHAQLSLCSFYGRALFLTSMSLSLNVRTTHPIRLDISNIDIIHSKGSVAVNPLSPRDNPLLLPRRDQGVLSSHKQEVKVNYWFSKLSQYNQKYYTKLR